MILSSLILQQFRSYQKRAFQFSPHTTLLVGPNTVGKTNILEALYLLATGKSFRADVDREVIAWGAEVGTVAAKGDDMKLEMVVTGGTVGGQKTPLKKYLVNGVARRMIDFIGNLRAVLFWPEHLELVTDSPSMRRKYLDSVLVQVDREYRRNLLSYERGLRQRNRLLDLIFEGKAGRNQLLFWNQLLIKSGGFLTDRRGAFIDYINTRSLPATTYELLYDKSVISEARLEQYKEEEVGAKATLVGPHRDDVLFKIKDERNASGGQQWRDLSKYGSRGQQRLAILWLKLAEVDFIQKMTGERPILLLDDIFSELDESHRELVLAVLPRQQTIVTSAELNVIDLIGKVRAEEFTLIRL